MLRNYYLSSGQPLRWAEEPKNGLGSVAPSVCGTHAIPVGSTRTHQMVIKNIMLVKC
jgi:hypothetical protein